MFTTELSWCLNKFSQLVLNKLYRGSKGLNIIPYVWTSFRIIQHQSKCWPNKFLEHGNFNAEWHWMKMLNSSVLSSPKSQINFVKAWWHMRFLMQFLSHSPMQANATFITSEKKVAISLWFRVPCLLQFPKNWHQVASSFEHVPNMCDIVGWNRTEITASLHAQCNDATWAWQNLHWKVRQKLHQKPHV